MLSRVEVGYSVTEVSRLLHGMTSAGSRLKRKKKHSFSFRLPPGKCVAYNILEVFLWLSMFDVLDEVGVSTCSGQVFRSKAQTQQAMQPTGAGYEDGLPPLFLSVTVVLSVELSSGGRLCVRHSAGGGGFPWT